MGLGPCLHLKATLPRDDRPDRAAEDVSFSPTLVAAFLEHYTEPGDLILDPFAGFGTTLRVAEANGRRAVGVEIVESLVGYIRSTVGAGVEVIHHDARDIGSLALGPIDFVMTSPPYMTRTDHPQNPLTGYQSLDGDYDTYLGELQGIFRALLAKLSPGAAVVINVANLRGAGAGFTPLAWDVGRAVEAVMELEEEVVLTWDVPPATVSQDYCLVFRAPRTTARVAL